MSSGEDQIDIRGPFPEAYEAMRTYCPEDPEGWHDWWAPAYCKRKCQNCGAEVTFECKEMNDATVL